MPFDSSTLRRWRSLGWLAGLPVLGLLWAAATSVVAPIMSDSLGAAAAVVARESGCGEGSSEPWLRLEARGRDLVALGEAPDSERHAIAFTRLAMLPGLRRVIDETGSVEEASPFVWTAAMTDKGRIALTGHRPREIGAAALAARLTAVLPSGTSFLDRTRAARGGPPDFAEAAAYAARLLPGLKPGAVATLTDTILSFEGEAASPETYEAFRATREAPPHGFSIGRVEIAPPSVTEFRFVVERRLDGGTALSGHVVSEDARSAILAVAAEIAPGARVEDRMQSARGLPSSIDASALGRFALRLSGLMQEGSVRFERSALSVSGRAIDAQAVGEIEALMRDERPAGVVTGIVTLTAGPVSPYKLRVRREADSVVLSGHLPDRASRERLLAALNTRFFREAVTDRTRTAEGAPQGLVTVVASAIGALSTLAEGEIAVSDKDVRLSGESLYPESARRLDASLPQAMPSGWAVTLSIAARDAPERYDAPTCARLFTERTAGRSLRFAAGSSELTPEFYPVLDALADLGKHCPSQRVDVVGHADPAGVAQPQAKALPEFTSSLKATADPATKPAKDAKKGAPAAKGGPTKDASKTQAAKPEATPSEPAPEPLPDLSQQRALAVVDYLRKAGLPTDRVATGQGTQPSPERRGIGFALRS